MRRISIPLAVVAILLFPIILPSPGQSCNFSEGSVLDHVKGLFDLACPMKRGQYPKFITPYEGDWDIYALSFTVESDQTHEEVYWITLHTLNCNRWASPFPLCVVSEVQECFFKSSTTDWPWDEGEYAPYPDYPIIDPPPNFGVPPGNGEDRCATMVGNPINVGTGNKFHQEADFSVNTPGPELAFRRFYNSQSTYSGPLGYGWTHNYNLSIEDKGTWVIVWDADGKALRFRKELDGSFTAAPLVYDRLVQEGAGTGDYVLFRKNNAIYRFDPGGRLRSIGDLNGNRITLTYDGDLLKKVRNNFGKEITFTYHEEDSKIETATDPKRNTYAFAYTGNNLTGVVSPDGYSTEYLYEDPLDPHNMTGKRIAGRTVGTWRYDEHDRATYSSKADGAEAVSLTYHGPPGSPDAFKVKVTDSRGNERTYHLWALYGIPRVIHIGGVGCSACPGSRKDYDYHSLSFALIQVTGWKDNMTDFSWDDRGNIIRRTEASGTDAERTTIYTYTYDENNPLLGREKVEIRESVVLLPGGKRVTTWRYDEGGNLRVKKEEGYVLVDGEPSLRTYTTEYGYTELRQLRWIDGPRTDVSDLTHFEYYENSEIAGDNRGQLKAIINALDHRTEFSEYDANGNVGRIADPNGVVTAYTYDERNRIRFITNQVMGATTEYTYDSHGNLDYLVLPEGNSFDYTHDPADRLTEIKDTLGNRIGYTPDSEGNRIREEIFDTEEGLVKVVSMEYDDRNRLEWVKHPDGFVRHYEYDPNGNIYSIRDENEHLTEYRYDGLDRLRRVIQHTDIKDIVTEYTYDSHDSLWTVTDGNKNTTTYVYDDFSRVQEIISPDTGTTDYVHDEAGNLIQKTDAKGTRATYIYDALNRLTGVCFPDSSQDIAYSYDSSSVSHGIGRLTGMTDPSGTYASHYNPLGNVTREEKTIKGLAYTTEYRYDREGVLTGLTYPSGRSVDYKFDDARRVRRVTTARNDVKKTVAKDISYLPFGPLKDLTYGNGITLSQGFDLRYQLETLQAGGVLNLEYERDGVGNIEAITNHLDPTRSQGFHYDALERLRSAQGIYGTIGYMNDDVGNRLTKTVGDETDTYVYSPGTNRLSAITGGHPTEFTYDPNGNTKSMGAMKFRYDQNDRLIKAIVGKEVVGRYTYNGRGQRTVKKTENGMTIYHYDLWGHLIAETKKNGRALCEYLYLDDRLLAMAPKGGSRLLFAHTDHLGTPLKMSDKKGIVVWQADYRPFGKAVVDEDPDGDGKKVILNLRFPGQYFDEETRLHYNYFRDYHPAIGRYIEPDPVLELFIGKLGEYGSNVEVNWIVPQFRSDPGKLLQYVYVINNPIRYTDPEGLVASVVAGIAACLASPPCAAALATLTAVTIYYIQKAFHETHEALHDACSYYDPYEVAKRKYKNQPQPELSHAGHGKLPPPPDPCETAKTNYRKAKGFWKKGFWLLQILVLCGPEGGHMPTDPPVIPMGS